MSLRHVWLIFVASLFIIGAIVLLMDAERVDHPGGIVAAGIAALGLIAVASSEIAGRRALDCESVATLAGSFRSRFFLRVAITQAPSLIGFSTVIITGRALCCLLGALSPPSGSPDWHLPSVGPRPRTLGCEHNAAHTT